LRYVQVYFDELLHHSDMDTLADSVPVASAAHSSHVTPAGSRHQSRSSTPPEAVVSPTDLSMRRDRSTVVDGTFTSPSSGFDSPSMHAGAGSSSGVAAVDGTAGSGCSDSSAAADADRSASYVTSPSPRAAVDTQHVSSTLCQLSVGVCGSIPIELLPTGVA